ncbi:hypothetical protein BY996DRAFT_2573742 [Phakopsora pachyrhizi]|uniref:Secreted protein n=1 Tax=Phakopsora pachyrhizi TaxID=170000 RepID=A0AAV0AYM6_PHAPC|nr:hypothetical protein BY996DRAFT_2573742 [Phakopsora pachyrhizi]CAH7674209.1 hypothetical protein PPACK8108_LOCUS9121 [Phakopsora pachyrhizi]
MFLFFSNYSPANQLFTFIIILFLPLLLSQEGKKEIVSELSWLNESESVRGLDSELVEVPGKFKTLIRIIRESYCVCE